jgi:hypothetical protein
MIITERHYTPSELAKSWGLSSEKVRQLFRNEPGVLRLTSTEDTGARSYVSLRIPESVAVRVHARLTALPKNR